MQTRMDRHIIDQSQTKNMWFERMKGLSLDLRRPMETTASLLSFLHPMILIFETGASSEGKVETSCQDMLLS